MELIFIMLLTLILAPVVEFTAGPARIILGAIFVLFFPGYTLLAALFPRKNRFQSVERVVLSFVSSLAIVPLIMLILNYTPWHIHLESIFASVAVFIFIASAVALTRRWHLPQSEKFEPRMRIRITRWNSMTRIDKVVSSLLVLLIMGAAVGLFYVVTAPKEQEDFTEFYMLGSQGTVQDYPRQLVLGEQAEVTLVIANHEHEYSNYTIEMMLNGERVQEIGPRGLADGEKWSQAVTLAPTQAGQHQEFEFSLYRGDDTKPYLTLQLWIDVEENK
ncbi:MAG TPA: DUF1616 domain-containing protein [Dehalococcoidia bacterium]|nr:DUF1616 domain-containing protein [Dehalococcoidia bacterium]